MLRIVLTVELKQTDEGWQWRFGQSLEVHETDIPRPTMLVRSFDLNSALQRWGRRIRWLPDGPREREFNQGIPPTPVFPTLVFNKISRTAQFPKFMLPHLSKITHSENPSSIDCFSPPRAIIRRMRIEVQEPT
jgi:hypothetical protein